MGAFLDWFKNTWLEITGYFKNRDRIIQAKSIEEIEQVWASLSTSEKNAYSLKSTYEWKKTTQKTWDFAAGDPMKVLVTKALDEWLTILKRYEDASPEKAKANLAQISADVMKISGSVYAAEVALGKLPWLDAEIISGISRRTMGWLGFGAVITAIAHDPVKIGILRPYQDSLEQTFRNRRPDSGDLFNAYMQRSLSSTKIDDVDAIDDGLINRIESENEQFYDREISKWGYSDIFSNALKDSATKTLSFGNLMALAKQGRLSKGMAAYSLWGYGLDRRLMKSALESLEQANTIANYEGFRAQIEPAYIEGIVSESDLTDYWNKINVPADVQSAMLPRFRKKREAYERKQTDSPTAKERDLTVSQIQNAYLNNLIDRAKAQNMITGMGFSLEETTILLELTDLRRKVPGATSLKQLPLSDYEKAYKNKLITLEEVIDRMKGEYSPHDVQLERKLLESGKA